MTNRPEDGKRLLGISVALVCVLATIVFRLRPGAARADAPPAVVIPPAAAIVTPSAPPAPMLLGRSDTPAPQAAREPESESGARDVGSAPADPFHPIAHAVTEPAKPTLSPRTLPPPSTAQLKPFGPPAPPADELAKAAPEPQISLKGVIVGRNAIAVLEVGGRSVMAHVGDKLPGGGTVEKIEDQDVVIHRNAASRRIQIGSTIGGLTD